jgi:hypothetical protein
LSTSAQQIGSPTVALSAILKAGDTAPAIVINLAKLGVSFASLTGATASFSFISSLSGAVAVNHSATIVDPLFGVLSYSPGSGDFAVVPPATSATYTAEFKISYSGGGVQRVPDNTPGILITVLPAID